MMTDTVKYFISAVEKWRLYDNSVCHEIKELVDNSAFSNHNFYEFAKGFVFASIDIKSENEALREDLKQNDDIIAELVTLNNKLQSENNELRECVVEGVKYMRSKQSYDCVLLNKLNKCLEKLNNK